MNDFEKGQYDWYGSTPDKHTWKYFKTHFEADLGKLKRFKGIPHKARLTIKKTFCKLKQPTTFLDNQKQ